MRNNTNFLIHRFFRLFPLAFTFIFIFYFDDFNSFELILNLALLQNISWRIESFPGAWSISSEWIFSLLLILIKNYSKKYLFILIGLSSITSIIFGLYVYSSGGADLSLGLETYEFRTWLNTLNPIINFSYFLVGICIKKQFINLNNINLQVAFIVLCSITFFDIYVGHLMVGWLPVLAIIFTLCLKYNSKYLFLNRTFTFIGKRTYGIFFAHFLFWQNLKLLEFYEWLNITELGLLFKLINFFIVFFLSLVVAIFSYEFIEKPFMKISNYFEKMVPPNNK